jgi:hypothetical protein
MRVIADTDLSGVGSVIVWSAVLLGLILLAFFGYSQFKRWMSAPDEQVSAGFGLSEVREMHRLGKITDAEFEMMKTKLVASAKRMTEKLPGVIPNRGAGSKNITAEPGPDAGP